MIEKQDEMIEVANELGFTFEEKDERVYVVNDNKVVLELDRATWYNHAKLLIQGYAWGFGDGFKEAVKSLPQEPEKGEDERKIII